MELIKAITYHAPIERLDRYELLKQVDKLQKNELFRQTLNSINILILVINAYRQVVHLNEAFLNLLGIKSSLEIIGKRPGEILNCIHAEDNAGGCGTSEACRYCNLVNLTLKSIKSNSVNSGEVLLTTKSNGIELPINMSENVSPFEFEGETLYVVSLIDISDAKRKIILERIFFHDIINTSGGLKGLISLLKEDVPNDIKPEVGYVEDTFNDLLEEIKSHQMIMNAENNELELDLITLKSDEIIASVAKIYSKHEVSKHKTIVISENDERTAFKSDFTILKRVLGNMLKNALEATDASGEVIIGCKKVLFEDCKYVQFWVNNKTVMPRSVQLQVFQRSFSTKGGNRGLGTYSMKLLGERYLKGKVEFTSNGNDGTTFYVRILL